MIEENFSLTKAEIDILRSSIGKNLISIETGHSPDGDDFWWPVRINADMNNFMLSAPLKPARYFQGTEDCSRLSVHKKENFESVFLKNINEYIQGINIIVDEVRFPKSEGCESYKSTYPIAIVFDFGNSSLVCERGWIFEEFLTITLQDNSVLNIRDALADWYDPDEDTLLPEIKRHTISLNALT